MYIVDSGCRGLATWFWDIVLSLLMTEQKIFPEIGFEASNCGAVVNAALVSGLVGGYVTVEICLQAELGRASCNGALIA